MQILVLAIIPVIWLQAVSDFERRTHALLTSWRLCLRDYVNYNSQKVVVGKDGFQLRQCQKYMIYWRNDYRDHFVSTDQHPAMCFVIREMRISDAYREWRCRDGSR